MVNRIVVDRTIGFLKDMASKAIVVIDGVGKEMEIHSQEVVDNKIKTYVYLYHGHGSVTEAILVDRQGIHLDNYETNIQPSSDGLMIVFELGITLKGVSNL